MVDNTGAVLDKEKIYTKLIISDKSENYQKALDIIKNVRRNKGKTQDETSDNVIDLL